MSENRSYQETVREKIAQGASSNIAYFVMNTLATIVASYGLLANSTAVVIGAMIIAMLLGPITGVALALVDGDTKLLRIASLSELYGVVCVLGVAFIIGTFHTDIPIGSEIMARTAPNIMDLLIALAGGAAGAYASVSPRLSVGLVGVAIATALVPPLACASILFARGETHLASGAFLLFFANFIGIQVASSAVLWAHGYHRLNLQIHKERSTLLQNILSITILFLLSGFLWNSLRQSLEKQHHEQRVRQLLQQELLKIPGSNLSDFTLEMDGELEKIFVVARTPKSITPQQVARMEACLKKEQSNPIELHVRSVLVSEATKEGFIYSQPTQEETEAHILEALFKRFTTSEKPENAETSTQSDTKNTDASGKSSDE